MIWVKWGAVSVFWSGLTRLSGVEEVRQRHAFLCRQRQGIPEVPQRPALVLPAHLDTQTLQNQNQQLYTQRLLLDLTRSKPARKSGKSFFNCIASFTAAATTDSLACLKRETRSATAANALTSDPSDMLQNMENNIVNNYYIYLA